ncbi:hypothetical protein [Chitinophaga sp. MM2321]|uniref:hypothetical protein n=1 Tax=Chitinophaga sp. MM2321 TaxID=3137178 RepID=UPI0032D589C1
MDSLKLADFLFDRIHETIDYKEYIAEVNIGYEYSETYGNKYIRISYSILCNEIFDGLTYNKQQTLFQKPPNYTFSLSTNRGRERYDEKKRLLRIIEFRHLYESLASYAVIQFERYLNPETSIKIKGIDLWPEANYAEKYLLTDLGGKYKSVMHSDFELDVAQFLNLHQLADKSRRIYAREKKLFSITDIEINKLFGLKLCSIRFILLSCDVPIKIKGAKTIDEIHIHIGKFVEALEKEIKSEYGHNKLIYKELFIYIYDNYLLSEKIKNINYQQSEFLEHFIIQKGDILQLKDMRIVIVDSVLFVQQNVINIRYAILKNNLQAGERTRIIGTGDILYILKGHDFLEYTNTIQVKHLSLLEKWMSKRKMKLKYRPFELDRTKVDHREK